MSTQGTPNYEYHLGGCLPVDAPSYVTRKADEDLYQSLMTGHYCYALNSRQMGKSSLRVRTWRRLRDEGVDCATVDISGISTDGIRPADWYFGVAYRLGTDLGLFADFSELVRWWQDREPLPPAQRLADYIEVVLLEKVRQDPQRRIVVFVDEIDSLFKLEFGDDFFDLIRNCHGKRAIQEEYAHLTFAFMGVADPSDLIKDKHRPPFNIGEAIALSGFRFEEARQSLVTGLATKSPDPDALLLAILHWTDGQPFLTQKICDLAAKETSSPEAGAEASWVSKLIKEQIVDNWEAHDTPVHFRAIRDRILQNKSQRTGRLLGLYQRILREEELEADSSLDQMELRLSGLVVVRNRKIRVSNPIYRAVFDEHWTQKRLSELRPYGEMLEAWLDSGRADDSRLLRGQALIAANEWAAEKKLSDDDYEFLAASEKLDKAGIQNALDVQEEEKRILLVAKQRADKRIRIGGVILALSLTIAAVAVVLGVASLARARSERQAAQQETATSRANLNQTQMLLKNAGTQLEGAQTELNRITPELSSNRTELAKSKLALADLQAELKNNADQLKAMEIRLENKPFETYLAAIRKVDGVFNDEEIGVYIKGLVEILKSRGPQYENRVSAIKGQIKESHEPKVAPSPLDFLSDRGSKAWNRIYELILYQGTGDRSWKGKIFDSCREEARALASFRDDSGRLLCVRELELMDWNSAETVEITRLYAELILKFDLPESTKASLFRSIWINGIFERDSFHIFRKQDPQVFLDLVEHARDTFRSNGKERGSGSRLFLKDTVPAAYWVYAGQLIVQMSEVDPRFREQLKEDIQAEKKSKSAPADFPENDDPGAWKSWMARNSQIVSLWDEPELTTLRKHPEILEAQMQLWP